MLAYHWIIRKRTREYGRNLTLSCSPSSPRNSRFTPKETNAVPFDEYPLLHQRAYTVFLTGSTFSRNLQKPDKQFRIVKLPSMEISILHIYMYLTVKFESARGAKIGKYRSQR